MADRRLSLSDVLCFIVSKVGRCDSRSLKLIIMEYYKPEDIVTAKCRLLDDVKELKVDSLPRIVRRREGENYAARDLDDIFYLLSYLDEQKLMASLPMYVTDDPDRMPSSRLFEGDLKYFFKKLDALDNKVESYWNSMAAIFGEARSHLSEWPPLGQPASRASQKSTLTHRPVAATTTAQSDATAQQSADQLSWAATSSTPSGYSNRFSALASACEGGDEDGDAARQADEFEKECTTVTKKRRRIKTSSPVDQQSTNQSNVNQPINENNANQVNTRQIKPRKLVIGSSANGRSKISAAGVITKKRVYCLDNVSAMCDVEDIKQHIASLSVRLYTCHQVKPRRRHYNDEREVSRTAFRVCIAADDRDRLLDPAAWPDSIIIADWYFKPRGDQEANGRAPVDSDLQTVSVHHHPQQLQQQSDLDDGSTDMEACNYENDNVSETTVLYRDGAASDDS